MCNYRVFLLLWGLLLSSLDGRASLTAATHETTLNLTEGTWMNVDVSPDGRLIAFDLLNDIYVLPVGSVEAKVVHTGPAEQRSPHFSPDGKKLLYISDETGADNVWMSDLDGKNAKIITNEHYAMVGGASWAPDGQSIIAVKTKPDILHARTSEIHQYAISGEVDDIVVPMPASMKDIQEPRYSPDGRYIYYTERVGGDHYVYVNTGLKNFEIKRLDTVSGETVSYIAGFGSATTAQVSPDGKTIAFIRRVGAKTSLFVLDTQTRTQRLVYDDLSRDLQGDYIPQENYYPAFDWFPDNKHVAIWSKGKILKLDTVTGIATNMPFSVVAKHTLQPAVRFKQNLVPENFNAKIIRNLALSPDGKNLLFRAVGKLWQQDMEQGSAPTRFTGAEGVAEHEPDWSTDGQRVAYVSWDDETGSKLIMRNMLDNSERTLIADAAVIREPKFSNNGQYIAYRIMQPDSAMTTAGSMSGLYIIDVADPQPKRIAVASGVARFSPDDTRVYFFGEPDYYAMKAVILRSSLLNGTDMRDHAYAATADTGEFQLSPDLKWLGFKEYNVPYIMPFTPGSDAPVITAGGNPKVQLLSPVGGYEMAWAADSSRLMWMLGADLYEGTPGEKPPVAPRQHISLSLELDRPEGSIAFVGARIIPMTGPVIRNGIVVVTGNKITAVGPKGKVKIPRGVKRIDVTGKTIMPGLFDAHGHIDCCFDTGVTPIKQPTRYAALSYGVTTNFDPYASDLTSYESAEMAISGRLVSPRWLTSGQVIYGRAGRPDSSFHPLSSLEDARALLKRRQALGPSILKSYKLTTRMQRQWLMQAAKEAGYMVDGEGAGEFYNNISLLLDGHTNIEHNMPVPTYHEDLLQLFAASNVSVTPTLIVSFGELFGENYIYQTQRPWEEQKALRFIPDVNNSYNPITGAVTAPLAVRGMQTIHVADEIYDVGFRSVARSVKALDDLGVAINVGSHGQVAGLAMHWEMQLMAEGGMAPMRILRAATINPANAYGVGHQIGTLEPGKLADLIVLDNNPLEDIQHTKSVRYTMINGRLYDADTLNEIGNYNKPRGKFFWEVNDTQNGLWNSTWAGE